MQVPDSDNKVPLHRRIAGAWWLGWTGKGLSLQAEGDQRLVVLVASQWGMCARAWREDIPRAFAGIAKNLGILVLIAVLTTLLPITSVAFAFAAIRHARKSPAYKFVKGAQHGGR